MKIQSIILICIIVIYQGVGRCQKLTTGENEERLKTCGKEFLPQPSQSEKGANFDYPTKPGWLLWVTSKNVKNRLSRQSTAFPISKRHVMTSSQVVLTSDRTWSEDGKPLNESTCVPPDNYVDLPKHIVDDLLVESGNNISGVTVLRGRVYRACGYGDFSKMFSPLLLEVEELPESTSENIPCLADNSVRAEFNTELHSYGYNVTDMQHHRLKIKEFTEIDWVYTTHYNVSFDRGGPLVMNYSNKATVIGLKTSTPIKTEHGIYFYSMMHMYNEICEYSGVCKPPPPSTTTTTTKAPTTPEPSRTTPDPSKTTNPKISTTKSPESPTKDPNPPKPSGKPIQKPEKGTDSEKESDDSLDGFKGDVEYVDEEDEVGVHLFFEPEVWNGSGKRGIELNFFVMLFLVMVLGT